MLEFVICEDNEKELKIAVEAVNKAMAKYDYEYKIEKYSVCSKKLREKIENNDKQIIYILDIELGKVSGLEIASKIREKDWKSFIVITTVNNDYKHDVFYSRLLVVDYIVKNVFYEKRLKETVEKLINHLNEKKILLFKYKNCVNRIPHESILYIEKMPVGRKSLIVTLKGNKFECPFTISELKEKLGIRFKQSHQSCIVNADKIERIDMKNNIIHFYGGYFTDLLSEKYKKELEMYVKNI